MRDGGAPIVSTSQAPASQGQVDRVYEIDEVRGTTIVKCMGRTFSAVAVGGEVAIADVTDITRPVPLGFARARNPDGVWRIVGRHDRDVLTTASLLRATSALWQAVDPAFARPAIPPAGREG